MPRDLPIGNGRMLVTFDQGYNLRDLFFPRVGQENHTAGQPCRFGIWVDGEFSWLENGDWERDLRYEEDALVTRVTATSERLGLRLRCADVVDFERDLYLKRVQVENLRPQPREVRLFIHFDCHLWGLNIGDTAYFEPLNRALVHYKGARYFWICGEASEQAGLYAYATGKKATQGLRGTWVDAEDGELSGDPVSQGSVDSVAALRLELAPAGSGTGYWWLAAGESYAAVEALHAEVMAQRPAVFFARTEHYWRLWVGRSPDARGALSPALMEQYRRSLLILRTQIDEGGAIVAANDWDYLQYGRDTYSYMWPRDGAFVAYALTQAGHPAVPRRFFALCAGLLTDEGYLLHKYNPDGSLGSSWHPWADHRGGLHLPIQEDETALVLWSLWEHYLRFHDLEFVKRVYNPLVTRGGTFLARYRDSETGLPGPSYDLWEERYGIFTFTTAAVWAGLEAARHLARIFGDPEREREFGRAARQIRFAALAYLWDDRAGRFLRGILVEDGQRRRDPTVDSSLFGLAQFGMLPPTDARVVATLAAVEDRLWCGAPVGGIARYEGDGYLRATGEVPGNPWILCTLWLADWIATLARDHADLEPTRTLLEWAAARALPSGVLAEQVHPRTGGQLSVSPLTWSHATLVSSIHHYLAAWDRLAGGGETE
jgi:GH15 family glucan-1,4-alpha-glucosidase